MEIAISLFLGVVFVVSGLLFWRFWQLSNRQEQLIARLQVAYQKRIEELQSTLKTKQIDVDSLTNALKEKQLDINSLTEAVDLSTKTIENIHRSISDTSFNWIEAVRPVEKPAQVIRKAHNITAREVYGSIRKVNRLVSDLSKLPQSRSDKKKND
ncbi:hypothetical protein [Litoribrevibacter albus]|uniref:Uncharacterized protein n=1 Tax=Litoribrevibacter albus TaxID=1473156 RepID=A0AA37W7D6_9GAMM|nr:hypothetical protein [Litoribrevibacter albus]GLQ31273.1 hypothetical protein GCM10007876_17520 [Litoribrevibacter albus]